MQPNTPMTKKEYWAKYWFSPTQMVTLINPKPEDYQFMVEMRHFVLRAGAQEQMPGTVANVYLSQMTRILAQDEDKFEFLSDFNLMKQYYDRLIVDVKDMMQEVNNTPAYLQNIPTTMQGAAPETPPWQAPANQAAPMPQMPETNSTMRDTLKDTDLKETKEVKEFEHGGNKYKMVVNKRGASMYYKNGGMISEAEYSKTVSML